MLVADSLFELNRTEPTSSFSVPLFLALFKLSIRTIHSRDRYTRLHFAFPCRFFLWLILLKMLFLAKCFSETIKLPSKMWSEKETKVAYHDSAGWNTYLMNRKEKHTPIRNSLKRLWESKWLVETERPRTNQKIDFKALFYAPWEQKHRSDCMFIFLSVSLS